MSDAREIDDDGDGWGDMDDDLDLEAEKDARRRLAKLSTRPPPTRPSSPNGGTAAASSGDGWGDMDDDDDDALFSGVAAATSGSGFGASAAAAAAARPTRPTLATRTVGGHVSLGGATRGVQRGNKPAPMKLGARKLNPGDIDLESMLN